VLLKQDGLQGRLQDHEINSASRNERPRHALGVVPAGFRAGVLGAICASSALTLLGEPAARAQASPSGVPAGNPTQLGAGAGTPGVAAPVQPSAVPQAATPSTADAAQNLAEAKPDPTIPALKHSLTEYQGLTVKAIQYEGVDFDKSDKLLGELTQKAGAPLDPDKVRQTTRRLFATGRYRNISVRVVRDGNSLTLIFSGIPRYYVGRVQIRGLKDDRLASLLEYGSELNPGTPYRDDDLKTATDAVKQVLAQNGYYEPKLQVTTTRDDVGEQVNVTFTVAPGPQARIGNITLNGKDPGITLAEFRRKGKLKQRSKVGRETTSNALSNLRTYYQKKNHLEASVSLQKTTYNSKTKTLNYDFNVDQGPVVQVKVEGAKVSKSRLHLLVPIYQEGTIDNDLLNEGKFNFDDFLQQEGYFDEKVAVSVSQPGSDSETVLYSVVEGQRHKVVSVEIDGNKYFSTPLLKARLKIQKGDLYQPSGRFSKELVKTDESSLEAIYKANGFSNVKVRATVKPVDLAKHGKAAKLAGIAVSFHVDEGTQQTFGSVDVKGADPSRHKVLESLINAADGQPFSLVTLSGDRDALLSYYLSNGFDQAKVEVTQDVESADKAKTDIAFNITEGPQVSVGKVLESGRDHTKQRVIDGQVRVHPADPLDQSALLETQRNLYNLALFNEVVAAVQNPSGDAEQKNVLLQLTEAKRWDITYGFGFEAQTGIPTCGMYCTHTGTTAADQGKAGVSPRVSIDVSRINLLGTQDSLTLHGTYGLLEEVALLTFLNPHPFNSRKFAFQVSGGYSNVQDISTFASQTLQGDLRVSQKATRRDTFIYDFIYRRVAVDPNSLEISANLIPILSEPVRVAGPQITWFRDTRQPTQLDASKGSYVSVTDFAASSKVGSQTDFNRVDTSYATYYKFGKYVFARNTRFGFIANYGTNPNITSNPLFNPCAGNLVDTNASCNPTPLPERLYAGGATSHRGFGFNDAGPRDLETGYPVGGSSVFVNTFELRLPPPVLPVVGDSISFVLFHDMGNVFQHVGDTFPSFLRFHQPDQQTCRNPNPLSYIGSCNFNYFSHAIGLGVRYRTPVGPIRLDLSYNLNPPYYPQYPALPAEGNPTSAQATHFNFFFSIGQSF
jgi:outer membrane protein assembly complex protein YaeT